MDEVVINADGGSRGNPGPAAIGVVIRDAKGTIISEIGERIGVATSNVAEYRALLLALLWLKENFNKTNGSGVSVFLDSELVTNQMAGTFKIKNENLRNLYAEAKAAEKSIEAGVKYFSVTREKNKLADFLVNKALDENR